jgi:hypothetical protein
MSNRDYCKKSVENKYDPQIGESARQVADTSREALEWSKQYYQDTVAPLLKQQTEASVKAQGQLSDLYGIQAEQMKLASDRYKQYGIPAEERYYNMVSQYNEPAEMERQAALAKGDVGQAIQNQQGALGRQMSSMGIDPTSGAAISARSTASVMNSAAEASAMNRARNAARTLGMSLTADAANFGRGGLAAVSTMGAGAQNASTGAAGVASNALNGGIAAGNGVQQGYGQAINGYSNVMGNYTSLGNNAMQASAAQTGAAWGALGSAVGLGAGFAMSDIRFKHNIKAVGELPSGITVYSFEYKPEFQDAGGHGSFVGVMAQEVEPVIPDAVITRVDGYKLVNYSLLR